MDTHKRLTGLILSTQAYKEHSLLLFVYTNQGKLTLVANQALKVNNPFRVMSQFLNLIEFEVVNQKAIYALKHPVLINDYAVIKNNYEDLRYVSLVLQIINRCVIEQEDHLTIFNLLTQALSQNIKENSLMFALKMIKVLGYDLGLKPNGQKLMGYNLKHATLVYENDLLKVDYPLTVMSDVLKLYASDFNSITLMPANLQAVLNFVVEFYTQHLETILKY